MLEVRLGAKVNVQIIGHSALNGAVIPEGSTVEVTSNDPTVATVDPIVVPAGGSATLEGPVNVLAVGATDIHAKVTTPDGSVFEATDTLMVDAVPVPGLARIELKLSEVPTA